jgi:hypothetical protein
VSHTLSFNALHKYDPSHDGITVPIILSNTKEHVKILAKVDTGATYCIFQREHGEALGIDIESGQRMRISTVTKPFLTYGHNLTLSVLGYQFDVTVYFSSDLGFPRNVLGRRGWLEQFRLGIVDYDGDLYISKYDEA